MSEKLPKMCMKHEILDGRYNPTCPKCRKANKESE